MDTAKAIDSLTKESTLKLFTARCIAWKWHDADLIDILEANGEVVNTLNKWQTWIFYEADGGRTVENLLSWIASHYRDQAPPPDLEHTILTSLNELVNDMHAVQLVKEGPVLPDIFLEPR